jgi:hypothetical protein
MRRALNGGVLTVTTTNADGTTTSAPISPILASLDNWQLLAILTVAAVVCTGAGILFFRWVENQAKERGMIDRLTGY